MCERNRDGEKQYMEWNEHNKHCLFDFDFCCCNFALLNAVICERARPSNCFVLFNFTLLFFCAVYLTLC